MSLSTDQDHGKVFGRLVWRGRPQEKDHRIGAALKQEWFLVEMPNYKKFRGTSEEVNAIIPPLAPEASISEEEVSKPTTVSAAS